MELNIGNDPNDEHQPAVSNSMMSAIVPLWVFSSCKKLYGNKLRGVHLCAGGLGTDTCQGDSGGALQCQIPVNHPKFQECSGWFVRGITSFGKGCNRIGTPGVYVDLSRAGILKWISDWKKVGERRYRIGKDIEAGQEYDLMKKNHKEYMT